MTDVYKRQEISGPNGYCIDTEEHEVVINWDTKPGKMNDIRDTEDVPDVEEPHGNNTPSPNGGIYVLETGEALNQEIQDAERDVYKRQIPIRSGFRKAKIW